MVLFIRNNNKSGIAVLILAVWTTVTILGLDLLFPLPETKDFSKVIYSANGEMINAYLSADDKWRLKTEPDEVSSEMITTLINKEDKWFNYHFGVNPVAVLRALYQNIVRGERVSGASTITMQVARMMNRSERTYINKFIEILRAFQLELHFSKKEILKLYLSYLPYGGNIEGVKAASYIYFNRPPDKLSLAQSVALTVIPNDPNNLRLDKQNNKLLTKRNFWLKSFSGSGLFDEKIILDAIDEPVKFIRYSLPDIVQHLSYLLSKNSVEANIVSTIDMNIQMKAERLLSNYVRRVESRGVSNGSVIIVKNQTGEVAAYCGSKDFYDQGSSGQVNGAAAVRSPGSALKPLLYTQAFDLGILTPKQVLLDIPTDFSGYMPENYDLKYNGEVTAEFALINSLNVPATRLLGKTGLNRFLNLLKNTGFEQITSDQKKMGLSVILGGCGVTLEELVRAYSALANGGKLRNLKYLKSDKVQDEIKIFSKEASYLTASILSSNERPDFPSVLLDWTNLPKIAWKTGTSYGKRDAWAIGFNPNFTIGVWMGNFDGKGSPYLSGAEMAVPLLFELFNSVDFGNKNEWFKVPEGIGIREVCSVTGMLPSKFCNSTIKDYFIKEISDNSVCDRIKEIYVDENEAIEYCKSCLPQTGFKNIHIPVYPAELNNFFELTNNNYVKPPKHNPECQIRFSGSGPKIISPSESYEYLLEKGGEQKILLEAASRSDVKIHHWYIDDEYYRKTESGEKLFFKPNAGRIKITCIDDKGRDESIFIEVKFY